MLAREILVASAVILQDRLPSKEDMNRVLLRLLSLSGMDDKAWRSECMCSDFREEIAEFFKLFSSQVDFEALKAVNVLGMRDNHPYGEAYRQFVDLHHSCFVRYCRIIEVQARAAGLDIPPQEDLPPVLRLRNSLACAPKRAASPGTISGCRRQPRNR